MEPMTMALLGGAALGAIRGKQNEKRMKENDKFRRAAIQYSPWTGMGDPGSQALPGMFESGLSGAVQGAALGNLAGLGGTGGAVQGGLAMNTTDPMQNKYMMMQQMMQDPNQAIMPSWMYTPTVQG